MPTIFGNLALFGRHWWAVGVAGWVSMGSVAASFTPEELPQVGYHPSGVEYFTPVMFANALVSEGRNWRVIKPKPGGQSWETISEEPLAGQVDALGNPVYLQSGQLYFLAHPGQNGNDRVLYGGTVVLTWEGAADIRVQNGTFVPGGQNAAGQPQSNGPATGLILNGTRVYQMGANPNGAEIRVHAITQDLTIKPRNIRLWLSHPDTGQSLIGQTFHPRFLQRVQDRPWGYIRFMDWNPTNASPQKDWADRRRPNHTFQAGVINPRDPAEGAVWYTNSQGQPVYFSGNRATGIAFEHMVALCNATNRHMWINVPHLATDDFVTKMAQLIRFGADANGNPYTTVVANPVYPPLNSNLKVYVEYSNEIWSNGNSFPQGNWAQMRAAQLGLTREQFNARRFCQVWRIFQNVFGSANRIVKVAAVFTANENYTRQFLNEIRSFGPTLSPAQEPDIIAPTTYFGNGIQDWAHARANAQAGTGDEWFYTNVDWDHDNNPATPPRKTSKPLGDAYWSSAAVERHINQAFDEWSRRLLSGSAVQGGGFDATGIGGGFDFWLRNLAQTTFPTPKPLVAYEGGPSLYTDYLDGGDVRDDGITNFIIAMNRHPRIKEVYRIHLNMAKAKGLWSHMMFVDASVWGKFGQWGHVERFSQDPATSPKYVFMREWIDTDTNGLRHIDRALNAVPSFATPASLPDGYVGAPYSQVISTTGGNGARTVEIIARSLVPGLTAVVSGAGITIGGTPTASGSSYVYARVKDADGDPAWRTFAIRTVVRSTDPAVTLDFESLAVTGGNPVAEPLDQAGYRFTSWGNSGGSGLCVQGQGTSWDAGWASKVLFTRTWGSNHRLVRGDGRPFDLFEIDLAGHQAQSARITGFAPGGIRLERVVNFPAQRQPMTRVNLDWITVERVEIQWFELPNAGGGNRNGAIDLVKLNTGTGIPGGGGGGGSSSSGPRYQAEAAQLNGATAQSGANSDGGYVQFGAAGRWVEFTVPAAAAGSRTLTIRYANGRPNGWTSGWTLWVNGVSQGTVWDSNTGSYSTWATLNRTITLNQGPNTIRIEAAFNHSSPVDWIEIP